MKKKINKKLIARIGAVLACVLLIGALAVPCFAEEMESRDYIPSEPTADEIKNAFFELYNVAQFSALWNLMNTDAWSPNDYKLYSISLLPPGSIINSNFLTYDYTQPPPGGSRAFVNLKLDVNTWTGLDLGYGYWTTNFTTSGNNRFWYFKFFRFDIDHEESREVLRVRVKIDKTTNIVLESIAEIKELDFEGTYQSYDISIATCAGLTSSAPIDYAVDCGFVNHSVRADYQQFSNVYLTSYSKGSSNGYASGYEEGYYVGYEDGYTLAYDAGYEDGKVTGHNTGYEEGYYVGYDDGYTLAYDVGYEDGKVTGYYSGYTSGSADGYNKGYDAGINEQQSEILGKNLLGETFSAPIEALGKFKIIQWQSQDGDIVAISMLDVVSAALGVTLVMWFLKMFAGG